MEGGTWEVALGNRGQFIYPYIKRSIPEELGLSERFDIISPYGYAGISTPEPRAPREWIQFRKTFRRANAERGCVAEFMRVGALCRNKHELLDSDPLLQATHFNDTITVPLHEGYDAYWKKSVGRSRTAIRKATRLGYASHMRPATAADMKVGGKFRELYDGTMARLEARDSYRLSDRYYLLLLSALGKDLLIGEITSPSGDIGSSALFMKYRDTLHYHLAGSRREAARDGANNLLIDAAIRWGIDHRMRQIHLGGGTSNEDGLFKFKAGFGGQRLPFHLCRSVICSEDYESLTLARAEQLGTSPGSLAKSGFFPAYRAS